MAWRWNSFRSIMKITPSSVTRTAAGGSRCSSSNRGPPLPTVLTRATGILFRPSGMITTLKEPDIKEHFVSLKMDFKLLNEHY